MAASGGGVPESSWPPSSEGTLDALPAAIDVVGLSKRFGRQVAVDDLSMTIPKGVIAGFVGP
ncbi:MAG: ABC transporter ATP-binding protein, partial [Acidimicrobiales bacterium]